MNYETPLARFKDRIKILVGDRKPYGWAKSVGLDGATFKRMWEGNTIPKVEHLLRIADIHQINIEWLLTGKEPMKRGSAQQSGLSGESLIADAESLLEEKSKRFSPHPERIDQENDIDDLNSLLTMTKEVLQSNTVYSASLAANVKSFYRAVRLESKISEPDKIKEHEERLTAIESQLQERKKDD